LAGPDVPLGPDFQSSLMGSFRPFSPETLRDIYGDATGYLARLGAAVDAAMASGVIVARDAEAIMAEATRDLPAALADA
jgi:Alpha/beta hydrolase domain